MKSTKVQKPQRNKCSAIVEHVEVETNCLVAEYCICAERAKLCLGKPLLVMHIGFSTSFFYPISLERSRFSKIAISVFLPL